MPSYKPHAMQWIDLWLEPFLLFHLGQKSLKDIFFFFTIIWPYFSQRSCNLAQRCLSKYPTYNAYDKFLTWPFKAIFSRQSLLKHNMFTTNTFLFNQRWWNSLSYSCILQLILMSLGTKISQVYIEGHILHSLANVGLFSSSHFFSIISPKDPSSFAYSKLFLIYESIFYSLQRYSQWPGRSSLLLPLTMHTYFSSWFTRSFSDHSHNLAVSHLQFLNSSSNSLQHP